MHMLSHTLFVLANLQAQVAEQSSSQGINWFVTLLVFIGMLVVLVFVHELGHFLVALLMKIKVDEFGIGYPPHAVTLFERNGVRYTLNWLPLGGFVRFAGEDNSVYGVGSLAEAHPWRKIPVMFAGPLMNLLLAMIIFAAVFAFAGIPRAIGQHISEVYEATPAAQAGFQTDDILVSLNEQPVENNQVINEIGKANTNQEVTATVLRDGETVELTVVPGPWTTPDGQSFESGFGFSYVPEIEVVHTRSIFGAIGASIVHTGQILVRMVEGLLSLVGSLFQVSDAPQGGVAGPIGIARATGEIIDRGGLLAFWNWMALISINLFVLNLLPIPALDGSHILFSLIEWVRGGKKVPPEKEAMVHAFGFIALMGLIVLVSVSDVINAIQGVSVLGGG